MKKYILTVRSVTAFSTDFLEETVGPDEISPRSDSDTEEEYQYWCRFEQAKIDGYKVIWCSGTVFVSLQDYFTKAVIPFPDKWILREPNQLDPVGDGDTLIVRTDVSIDDFELVVLS